MKRVTQTPETRSEIISLACQTLKNGGLVVYPTETTYGIGADCENPAAIAKLIAYKSKRDNKAFSVAVDSLQMAERYVALNDTAKKVYANFLPGPVTVVSKSKGLTAPGVDSTAGTLGIRIPSHDIALELVRTFGRGVTATGANASYQKRPYTIQDILDNISGKQKSLIDVVIDAGELPHNEPSTVIDTTLDDIRVSRFGPVEFTDKEIIISKNEQETEKIARELISRYRSKLTYAPLIIALTGEMGAGKTHFTKGLAQGLGISEVITSPTYSLANEHPFTSENREGLLVHVDTWKMESETDLHALNLPSFITRNAVVVIEWADRFTAAINQIAQNQNLIWVDLKTTSEDQRELTITHRKTNKL